MFLVRQSATKSLNAGEKSPSKTGGVALGIKKRTRIAGRSLKGK